MRPGIGRRVVVALVRGYQQGISPLLAPRCRYWPTCAEYARLVIERHGVIRGGVAAIGRLARCHPLGAGGIDPPR